MTWRPSSRAVSDVIGFVLVFGLVTSTVAIVSVAGFGALEDVRDAESVSNAERAFDVLADNMADVHQQGAPSRSTELSLTEAELSTASRITVNVTGIDTSQPTRNFTIETSPRPVVWRPTGDTDTEIVYALGAVVRSGADGGVVLEDPPFVLDDDRMLLPLVKTQSDQGQSFSGSTIRVRGSRAEATEIISGTGTQYDRLWLNITTPRADVWRQYLDRSDGTSECLVVEEGGDETVACALVAPDDVYVVVVGIDTLLEQ